LLSFVRYFVAALWSLRGGVSSSTLTDPLGDRPRPAA
jgi:hypothetical protein